jgi:hypothetical protein
MPKFARSDEPKVNQFQMKSKAQISKLIWIWEFGIPLALGF